MSGKKGKKSSQPLSTSTTVSSGTVIAHPSSTQHNKCQEDIQAVRDLMGKFVTNIFDKVDSMSNSVKDLAACVAKITNYLVSANPNFPNPPDITNAKVHQCSAVSDMEKILAELQIKSQTRLALIEGSISQVRTSLSEIKRSEKYSSCPTPEDTKPKPKASNLISSIEVGLRDLNKRIRKNNIVLHGLDHSKLNCVSQADNFFQNYLNLKIPIQQAYRLGSSTTTLSNPPLLVAFPSLHQKLQVFKNCKLLSGTPFSIQDDLSAEERRERRRKLEAYKSYKSQKKKTVFRGGELYVDGELIQC